MSAESEGTNSQGSKGTNPADATGFRPSLSEARNEGREISLATIQVLLFFNDDLAQGDFVKSRACIEMMRKSVDWLREAAGLHGESAGGSKGGGMSEGENDLVAAGWEAVVETGFTVGNSIVHESVFAQHSLANQELDRALEHLARIRQAVDAMEGMIRKIRGEIPPWERKIIVPGGIA